MLNNGIPVIVTSKILGHSKPSITLDIYGHLYSEKQGEVARLMDELVSPIKISLEDKILQTTSSGELLKNPNCTNLHHKKQDCSKSSLDPPNMGVWW
jgi:hypothetical protein